MLENLASDGAGSGDPLEALAKKGRSTYQTVEEVTLSVIRTAILSGVLAPGERLSQDRLADALDVSRMPVRAALRQLEGEGLVVFKPHRGAIVRVLSPEELGEIYDLRAILEPYAIRHAIGRLTDDDIARLRVLADKMASESDPEKWIDLREQFYQGLYELSGRTRTVELIMRLRSEVGRYWLRRRIAAPNGGHARLIDFLAVRDAEGAGEWVRRHLEIVSQELQAFMQAEVATTSD